MSLKDKIKKPNATDAFFNQYDKDNPENNNVINNKNDENIDDNNKFDIEDEDKDKTYVEDDNIVNVNKEDEDSNVYLQTLIQGKKVPKKKPKKVFTSFYMDPDLAVEVNKIAKKGEKGDKSLLINTAIRNLLKEYGVIK